MIERLHLLLTAEADALVAAGNIATVVLLSILIVALVHQLTTRTYDTDLKIIMTGLLMEAIGWTLHRGWYAVIRIMRELDYPIGLWTGYAYIPVAFKCLIIMGLALLVSPVLKAVTGWKCNPCWTIMGSWALYWAVYIGVKIL